MFVVGESSVNHREQIIRLSARIMSLRQDLAVAEDELDKLLARDEPTQTAASIPRRVAALLARHPTMVFGTDEIIKRLNDPRLGVDVLRSALGRLVATGEIERVDRGIYRAKGGGGETRDNEDFGSPPTRQTATTPDDDIPF
jgi:hypothetical protein